MIESFINEKRLKLSSKRNGGMEMAKLRFHSWGLGKNFDVELDAKLMRDLEDFAKDTGEGLGDIIRRVLRLGLAAEREIREIQ